MGDWLASAFKTGDQHTMTSNKLATKSASQPGTDSATGFDPDPIYKEIIKKNRSGNPWPLLSQPRNYCNYVGQLPFEGDKVSGVEVPLKLAENTSACCRRRISEEKLSDKKEPLFPGGVTTIIFLGC